MSKIALIKPCAEKDSVLMINPKTACEIALHRKKRAYVSFGSLKNYVEVILSEEVQKDVLLLSQTVLENLHLPDYPTFEVCLKGNELMIGPYIGLLVTEEDRNLTDLRLKRLMVFVKEYEKMHGAVVVFALDQVDLLNRLIQGYCYHPRKDCWERGVFPYPAAFYRTIGLSEVWQNHFLSVLGDKFFNSSYFNKWDMYQWFVTDDEIKQHLPDTVLYQSAQDILQMLKKFGKIVIKPVSGLKGHGIVKVSRSKEGIDFRYREEGVNHKVVIDKPEEMEKFVESRFRPGKYLIQQAIDLLTHNDSIIDFRCAVQKDQSNQWGCNGVIGRFGDKGSVVSNISSGGTTYEGVELLTKELRWPEKDAMAIKRRMEAFAVKVCTTLDEFGFNCGTLGLDIGVDAKGYLWLIEINNRDPSPRYALDLKDEALYHKMKIDPLFYAKSLAGFGI